MSFLFSMITTAKSRHAEPENRSEKHSSKTVERRTGLQAEQKKQKAASAMKRIRPSFVFTSEQKSFGSSEHQFAKELHEQ